MSDYVPIHEMYLWLCRVRDPALLSKSKSHESELGAKVDYKGDYGLMVDSQEVRVETGRDRNFPSVYLGLIRYLT